MIKNNKCVENIQECDYKGEHYSAREDGTVYRHTRIGKRIRKYDNIWTLGKKDLDNGYMFIDNARVHIIIATAFLGEHDSKVYVVDHIDTNRCNNRIENLRWLTRLENALNNEITRKKIELICGSAEAFLENPSMLNGYEIDNKNFIWMKTVSQKEAKACLDNWKNWARSVRPKENYKKGDIGDWIFHHKAVHNNKNDEYSDEICKQDSDKEEYEDLSYKASQKKYSSYLRTRDCDYSDPQESYEFNDLQALTLNAMQRNWKTPSEFPCCPQNITSTPMDDYYNNLSEGKVYLKNQFGNQDVIRFDYSSDKQKIFVLSKLDEDTNMKKYALSSISFENGKFVHESEETFFREDGGIKYFTIAIGKEWTGDDTFDDYVR